MLQISTIVRPISDAFQLYKRQQQQQYLAIMLISLKAFKLLCGDLNFCPCTSPCLSRYQQLPDVLQQKILATLFGVNLGRGKEKQPIRHHTKRRSNETLSIITINIGLVGFLGRFLFLFLFGLRQTHTHAYTVQQGNGNKSLHQWFVRH